MRDHPGPIKALIAAGPAGVSIVVAHNSPWLQFDIENVCNNCADIGPDEPKEPGLWVWEGTAELVSYDTFDGIEPPEPQYTGALRPVRPDELAELLALQPPETCIFCGAVATGEAGRDKVPWCGGAECEQRIREADDC